MLRVLRAVIPRPRIKDRMSALITPIMGSSSNLMYPVESAFSGLSKDSNRCPFNKIGYRNSAAVKAKNPATILERYDRATVMPSILPAPWASEPIPGTIKPIIISGIEKLRNALKTVENETKI